MTRPTWREPRTLLWSAVGIVSVVFLVAMEFTSRHYGENGPITTQFREFVFLPKSSFLLYAGLALALLVLNRRERFIALGVAVGVDLVFLAVRLVAGADLIVEDTHPFGNGALWALIACGVSAFVHRRGAERLLLLKGVGLGLLLVAGRKTGDAWLFITAQAHPTVLDPYVALADHSLGSPSWLAGRLMEAADPVGPFILNVVYAQLPAAAVAVALYQLRHVARDRRFPRHHLVRTFLLIGLLGPGIYMIFPVVGPAYAYGSEALGNFAVADVWPDTLPHIGTPGPVPFDTITPRNCMPSLHTAWAVAIFLHTRKGPALLRHGGTFWLVATLAATLGFGWHYGVDLVAGVVFTLAIEAGLRTYDRAWDRSGLRFVAYGTAVFTAMLLSYRYLPEQMAAYPWASGPLLLALMVSVIVAYVRTVGAWDRTGAPQIPPVTVVPAPRGPVDETPAVLRPVDPLPAVRIPLQEPRPASSDAGKGRPHEAAGPVADPVN